MAVQLANVIGAHVIGTGSGRNEEFVRGLGADEFIDYKKGKFEEEVSDVDVVFDTVGSETQDGAFRTLKRGGVLVSTVNPPSEEKAKQFGVKGAMVMVTPKPDQLAEINRLVESGKLKVRVAVVLPLADTWTGRLFCGLSPNSDVYIACSGTLDGKSSTGVALRALQGRIQKMSSIPILRVNFNFVRMRSGSPTLCES